MNTQEPDTQEVNATPKDVQRAAFASVFTSAAAGVAASNPAPVVAAEETPQGAAAATVDTVVEKALGVEKPAEQAPAEQPVAQEKPAEVAADDVFAQAAAAFEAPAPTPTWDDNAKAAFKAEFGVEDPQALKTQLEQFGLVKEEYEKVKPIVEQINALPAGLLEAFNLALSGKVAEARQYLASTPEAILESRDPAKMTERELVDTHYPGKIKPEQWDMLNDPEADPEIVDALKTRIGLLKDAATDKQTTAINAAKVRQEQEAKARQDAFENYQRGVASTLAIAKESPLKGLLDKGTVEQIQNGSFLRTFVQEDGVTPTPEAATRLLWALHGPKLREAAEARGYARGKSEAALEAASRQPALAPGANRSAGDGGSAQADPLKTLVAQVLTAS